MAELVLENVSKTYGNGVEALRDICLCVHSGELLTLLGPSGCGKTTTLRLIAGLEQPTRGSIRIAGRLAKSIPPWQRNVGMAFQRPALYPQRTVRDNLLFGSQLRHPWRFLPLAPLRGRFASREEQDLVLMTA